MEVSVIMPVYNAAPFLERAIQSALDQPQVVELIAIDDASTDGSDHILESLAQQSERLIYLPACSEESQRAAAARNRGLAIAIAPFIAFLDADDYYLPGRFSRTEAYFEAHPEVEGLVEPVEVVYEGNERVEVQKYLICSCRLDTKAWAPLSYNDLIAPSMQMNGLTVRKAIFLKVKSFNQELSQVQDLDFGRRLIYNGIDIHIIGCETSPVAHYIHHETNTTYQLNEKWTLSAQLERHWIQKLSLRPHTRHHRWRLFYRYLIFKYHTPPWPWVKKAVLYPFLYLWEAFRLMRYLQ